MFDTRCLKPDEAGIAAAAEEIKKGEVVGMPTETVYGLAANALDPQAVLKIFKAKGRPADNPLIVHISSIDQIWELTTDFSATAQKLAEAFWPGPLTMILPKSDRIPYETSGGLDTVGIRMPSHPIARALIEKSGLPLAAPSANTSGKPSPTTAEHVYHDMKGKIPYVVDGGSCGVGVESTVILVLEDEVRILRPGKIAPEDFEKVVSTVTVDRGVLESVAADAKVASPGMKYKHYAPSADVIMIEGNLADFAAYVYRHQDGKTGVLAFEEDRKFFQLPFFRYGHEEDSNSQAEDLFDALRQIDEAGLDTVYARMPEMDGVGLAVYNRLLRACAFRVIHLSHPAKLIGLTGPTGSGKSSVSRNWKEKGAAIIDCDQVAREVRKDPAILQRLADAFGRDLLREDGSLNCQVLANRAFGSEEQHQKLNRIMLPPIIEKTILMYAEKRDQGKLLIVLDAPTLFESGLNLLCDRTVSVISPREIRAARIQKRDHLTEEEAFRRMSVQQSDEFYRSRADITLDNDADYAQMERRAGDCFESFFEGNAPQNDSKEKG